MAAGASKLTKAYQTPNAMLPMLRSQTARDKLGSREGNSPDLQLRSQSIVKWKRMWNCIDNQDVGLEAATH